MNLRRVYRAAGLVVLLLLGLQEPLYGQGIRPPELNLQFHRAEAAWRSGASVLEAKARVDRVLKELPDDVAARKLRAQVLLAMERPEEALEDARRAVELDSTDGEAYLILCEAARLKGDRHEALQALDEAAERVLDDAPLHVRLSWNALALDQLDKAEAFARIALALDEAEAAAYYQLARVFALQNKDDEAAEILSRGLRASVISTATIERDAVLSRIMAHPALEGLLKR